MKQIKYYNLILWVVFYCFALLNFFSLMFSDSLISIVKHGFMTISNMLIALMFMWLSYRDKSE